MRRATAPRLPPRTVPQLQEPERENARFLTTSGAASAGGGANRGVCVCVCVCVLVEDRFDLHWWVFLWVCVRLQSVCGGSGCVSVVSVYETWSVCSVWVCV